MKKTTKPKKTKRMSKEQLEDLLLSNYKPRRPSEEAIKRRKELLEKMRPLLEKLFPNAKRLGQNNEKEKTCHPKTQKSPSGFPHTNQNYHRKKQ
jgi:hypothetical protein